MRWDDVAEVLGLLPAERCRYRVAGGWGVDVLVGEQTRRHRDLDLAVDAEDETAIGQILAGFGSNVETDRRPIRVEYAAAGERWVDVHPVVFEASGDGFQAGADDGFSFYPGRASPVVAMAMPNSMLIGRSADPVSIRLPPP